MPMRSNSVALAMFYSELHKDSSCSSSTQHMAATSRCSWILLILNTISKCSRSHRADLVPKKSLVTDHCDQIIIPLKCHRIQLVRIQMDPPLAFRFLSTMNHHHGRYPLLPTSIQAVGDIQTWFMTTTAGFCKQLGTLPGDMRQNLPNSRFHHEEYSRLPNQDRLYNEKSLRMLSHHAKLPAP
jgi:hypothetical protein